MKFAQERKAVSTRCLYCVSVHVCLGLASIVQIQSQAGVTGARAASMQKWMQRFRCSLSLYTWETLEENDQRLESQIFFFPGNPQIFKSHTDHGTVATLQDRGYGTSSQEYSPSGLAEPVITSYLLHKFEVIFLFSGDKTTFE